MPEPVIDPVAPVLDPPIISGDPPAADPPAQTPEEIAAAEAAKAAEPKYDDKGFQVDKDGKQILDSEGKPIPKPADGPAEYTDFTVPEGAVIDEPVMAEFKTVAKELGLDQAAAQKLLDFGGSKIKAMAEAPYKVWTDMQAQWQAEVKADPEIGGTNLADTQKNAALVFQPGDGNPFVKNADEAAALKAALNTTGSGNNPAIVKLFSRLGALLKEPGSLTGNPPKADPKALQDKMYDKM